MACSSCGGDESHGDHSRCGNPCGHEGRNTALCESLPSQIENFTLQIFGTVVKTEVNGIVQWSLPCSLDVGLQNNPRGVDEGLACYFLRLFRDGIVGLTGATGLAGVPGTNGNNAYTLTTQAFTQPTLSSPHVQVQTVDNPAIVQGIYVNIATSGWYLVEAVLGGGALLLNLVRASSGAPGTIALGKLVVPSGFPGANGSDGAQGPQGVRGFQGLQGPAGPIGPTGATGATGATGSSATLTSGMYNEQGGANWLVFSGGDLAQVNFTASMAQVILPTPGTYLLTVVVGFYANAGASLSSWIEAECRNITAGGTVVLGTRQAAAGIDDHGASLDQGAQMVMNVIYVTPTSNNVIGLFALCSANQFTVFHSRTTMTYVRLA
jgi:hypothetical protein